MTGDKRAGGGLSVTAIAKAFEGEPALRSVSLEVRHGEIVGLLGPDGAGKTVCFDAIIGLLHVDAGQIVLNGEDVTDRPMDERAVLGLGYLPQQSSIFRGMTVAENILTVLELGGEEEGEAARRLDRLLAELNIDYVRDVMASKLSGGERRRCEIARALAADPSIMLLDEPFAGIDPLSTLDIKQLIRQLKDRDIGVLVSDQNVHAMLEIVDRAYILYEGEVLFHGTPADIVGNPVVRHHYLGDDFTA